MFFSFLVGGKKKVNVIDLFFWGLELVQGPKDFFRPPPNKKNKNLATNGIFVAQKVEELL